MPKFRIEDQQCAMCKKTGQKRSIRSNQLLKSLTLIGSHQRWSFWVTHTKSRRIEYDVHVKLHLSTDVWTWLTYSKQNRIPCVFPILSPCSQLFNVKKLPKYEGNVPFLTWRFHLRCLTDRRNKPTLLQSTLCTSEMRSLAKYMSQLLPNRRTCYSHLNCNYTCKWSLVE